MDVPEAQEGGPRGLLRSRAVAGPSTDEIASVWGGKHRVSDCVDRTLLGQAPRNILTECGTFC